MFTLPEGSDSTMTMIGIDPGTDTIGIAELELDIVTLKIVSSQSRTLSGAKLAREGTKTSPWVTMIHGKRFARIHALVQALLWFFRSRRPFRISSESPFINKRFPQAGLALTEAVFAFRLAVWEYDPWMEFGQIDPPSAKNAIGAKGNAKKEEVRDALLEYPDLNYIGTTPLEDLDEHSRDALAVVICDYQQMLEQLCLR
jgi:Holliday junction resolvasome RuvABC endonuclease subunit